MSIDDLTSEDKDKAQPLLVFIKCDVSARPGAAEVLRHFSQLQAHMEEMLHNPAELVCRGLRNIEAVLSLFLTWTVLRDWLC